MPTISAAVCRAFDTPLSIEDVELAAPAAGEILVDLRACAICHSDIMFIDGQWGGALPAVFGHEAAGVVAATGPGVEDIDVGDHVVVTLIRSCGSCHHCEQEREVQCETTFPLDEQSPLTAEDGTVLQHGLRTGAFAEQVVVHQSQVCVIPDDIDLAAASLLACGVVTGVGAVSNTAKVPAGATVMVLGCGGVGLNVVQGARMAGAATVLAADIADVKLEAAEAFGATDTVNAESRDVLDAVHALTNGRGMDYVFVAVGAKIAIDASMNYLAAGGTMVVVGMPASGVLAAYDPGNLAGFGQRIQGSKMGSSRVRVDIPKLVDAYRRGELMLDELVSGRFPLERINDAIAEVRNGSALRHVVVFP